LLFNKTMKYFFARTFRVSHSFFVFAVFTFVIGVVTLSDLPAQSLRSQSPHNVEVAVQPASAAVPGARSTDILLSLAQKVGEAAPAQRLVEYSLQADPSGGRRYWAIVDFNQPSTSKRLYVFDTVGNRVDTYYVAHGRGSEGAADDGIAERFSNEPSSNSSSLGIYRALNEYNGNHGRSMRLEGLEPTNSNALSRAVVMHKANYVSDSFIRATGRLGRSEGCFAVDPAVSDTLINELENGAFIIAWKGQAQTSAP
jgi:hypothetical protein